MFNSTVLDVMIGLAFVYLLLALINTTLNEWHAGIFKTRAKMLQEGIARLLGGQTIGATTLLAAFSSHPLVTSLNRNGSPSSYLPPRTFALTLMDLLTQQKPGVITFGDLETGINNLPDGSVKRSLLTAIQNTNRDLGQAQMAIEAWFNDAMDRVTGWYKRHKQVLTVVISAILVVFVNADTIGIANRLWVNPTLRQEIVNRAAAAQPELRDLVTAEYTDPTNPKPSRPQTKSPGNPDLATVRHLHSQLEDIAGWSADWHQTAGDRGALARVVLLHIPGWILTIIAVSLGAPFWFDLLNRFMNLRMAGRSPVEGAKGPRKDTSEEPAHA